MRTFKTVLITLVVLLVALGGLGAASVAGLVSLKLPFGTTSVDRSGPALLTSVQNVSRHVGAVGNFEVIVDVEDDVNYLPSFLAGERSLFIAAGTVDAYIDFATLREGDLTVSDDRTEVAIRLPAVELEQPRLDNDKTRLFSQERGAWNRIEDALSTPEQQDLYQQAESKIEDAAAESDLRARAEANTEAMLVGMFEGLEMRATVTFAE